VSRSSPPLSTALAPILGDTPAVPPRRGAIVPTAPRPLPSSSSGDPAVFLARRMDLHGSVALAAALEAFEAEPPAFEPTDPAAIAHVEEILARGLLELRQVVDRALVSALPPHARSKIPGPKALAELLDEAAVVGGGGAAAAGERSARAIESTIRAVWAPLSDLLHRGLERARAEARALREMLADPLRALGPGAARLEQLDAALARATERGTAPLFAGLGRMAEEAFARELRPHVVRLSPSPDAAELAAWFAPRGALPEAVLSLRRVIAGAADFERRRIEALVHACRNAC
jgi:hypothetical protein